MDGPPAKKIRTDLNQQSEEAEWFSQRRSPDNVTLQFDDGKQLSAPRKLLIDVSPVFEEILKEPKTSVVDLSGNNYDNFVELLRCLNRRKNERVTNKNVFKLVGLAQKYKITQILEKCGNALTIMMRHANLAQEKTFPVSIPEINEVATVLKWNNDQLTTYFHSINIQSTNKILEVLSFALKFQDEYSNLIDEAVYLLSCIKAVYYLDFGGKLKFSDDISKESLELQDQNRELFQQFDIALKERIYQSRLSEIDTEDH